MLRAGDVESHPGISSRATIAPTPSEVCAVRTLPIVGNVAIPTTRSGVAAPLPMNDNGVVDIDVKLISGRRAEHDLVHRQRTAAKD